VIRIVIFISAAIAALFIYLFSRLAISASDLQDIRLAELYGFASLGCLWVALLITPLFATFPALPGKAQAVIARRAIGVSAFVFALLHASVAFFKLLAGWEGLGFLSQPHLNDVLRSALALLILFSLAATSTDWAAARLGRIWKRLHRLLYLAALLALLHTFILGSHFLTLAAPASIVTAMLASALLLLEAIRIDKHLTRYKSWPLGLASAICIVAIAALGDFYVRGSPAISLHATHFEKSLSRATPRLSASVTWHSPLRAGSELPFEIRLKDERGETASVFDLVNEKLIHLVVVDDTLTYFAHVHPELKDGIFQGMAYFPREGLYYLYAQVQPKGGEEQAIPIRVRVGEAGVRPAELKTIADTASVEPYEVRLTRVGDDLRFSVRIAGSGEPVKLNPYLGALGHLVLINATTYGYAHVHPLPGNLMPVVFELHEKPTPGLYKAFFEFDPAEGVKVAEFTLRIN
jgi:DMSO/TMAO reductase YedYZ heme-binding membrane subunit